METALLLTAFEPCWRKGIYSRDWRRFKLTDTEMLQKAIRAGLLTDRTDFGEVSGSECMSLGGDPGLHTEFPSPYDQVVNLANLADILTTAIRKPKEGAWQAAGSVDLGDGMEWVSSALLDQSRGHLRRITLVSSWNEDRHYSECRSWFSLGEIAAFGLPMQMIVAVIGPNRGGKRHSPWTKAFSHPKSRQIRFQRRNFKSEGFKDTWNQVWREDNDQISAQTWLQGMLDDGILRDHLFVVDIPVPTKENRERILDLARRKLDRIRKTTELPEQNLSTCDWPTKCPFRDCCHSQQEPSGRYGFVRIDSQ